MDEKLEVSEELWLVVEESRLARSGIFSICDNVGGGILIDAREIPALIEVLQKVQARKKGDTQEWTRLLSTRE